jgi:predicted flap endonuclease-1-like 5' DNA nuclease
MLMEWYWWLSILLLVILVLWWALCRNAKATEVPEHEDEHHNDHEGQPALEPPVHPPAEEKVVPIVETRVDDLEIIEGIGPKIASVLREAGITTFVQLAKEEPGNLKVILDRAGIRLADPVSWPEQAKLAAEVDREGLKTLQDRLKGGREKA